MTKSRPLLVFLCSLLLISSLMIALYSNAIKAREPIIRPVTLEKDTEMKNDPVLNDRPAADSGATFELVDPQISKLVDELLESDEELQVLIESGMRKELSDHFKTMNLDDFDVASEVNHSVHDELKRRCKASSAAKRLERKNAKKQYSEQKDELIKQFKKESGAAVKKSLKGKKVRIACDLNEVKYFRKGSATDEFE